MTVPLTLVILAAGRSTRFGRLKQLTPIGPGGTALLDYALYDAALAGFSRFLLVIQEDLQADFDAHLHPAATAGLDLRYAYQSLSHPGLVDHPPPGRTRPWGTGHAVLAGAEHIDGPFALCNADDFYGRGAYAALADVNAGCGKPPCTRGPRTRASRPARRPNPATVTSPHPHPHPRPRANRRLSPLGHPLGERRCLPGPLPNRRDGRPSEADRGPGDSAAPADRVCGRDVAGRQLDVPLRRFCLHQPLGIPGNSVMTESP